MQLGNDGYHNAKKNAIVVRSPRAVENFAQYLKKTWVNVNRDILKK
jgi:uroporphyrinogen-III synthase